MNRHKKYYDIAHKIAKYLATSQTNEGTFPARTCYGETFAILLWSYFGDEFKNNISKALEYYSQVNKTDPEFHWEFNNYAISHYYLKTKDARALDSITNLRFKNTKVTNWTLLRNVTRLLVASHKFMAFLESDVCLIFRQKIKFIRDETNAKTFQYHCFSTALLGELYLVTGKKKYKQRFLKGSEFISDFIMPNGDSLYIGRGQEQIFGYGTLLFVLEYAHILTNAPLYKKQAEKVLCYVLKFQRRDGSFPLVLRTGERGYPKKIDTKNKKFVGWYSYNNFFDYLPFFGYYVARIHFQEEIRTAKISRENHAILPPLRTILSLTCARLMEKMWARLFLDEKEFKIYSNKNYKAVISRPGGFWTNDQAFPYVCYKNKSIFPCFGGEQSCENLYSIESLPLPFGKLQNRWVYFEDMEYELRNDELIGNSEYSTHRRTFGFSETGFIVDDEIKFKKKVHFEIFLPINLFFFNLYQLNNKKFESKFNGIRTCILSSSSCYVEDGDFYCARGKMDALREKITNRTFLKGEVLERRIKIEFSK